jgi:hypothetical protein
MLHPSCIVICVEGQPLTVTVRKDRIMTETLNVTAKHNEVAWQIAHDPSGNLHNEAILLGIIATLLAKTYGEEEL